MNSIECETCIKRKTMYCPNSAECFDSENKPHYQSRIMLLEENEQLKEVNSLSKIELYKISEDRLDVILKLTKELKKYKKLSYKNLLEKNNQLKSVLDEIKEYMKEIIKHYEELINEEYNQETSVFVNETCKKGFILNIISYLDLLNLQILDKVKE